MLRLALLISFLTAAPLAAQAPQRTGVLEGVVRDDTGETLPLANVKVEGTTLGTTTNMDGEYRLVDVPVGTYTVTASFVGFEPEARSEIAVYRGAPRVVDFELGVYELYGCPTVVFERPILSNDPFASRVVSAGDLVNLPVR